MYRITQQRGSTGARLAEIAVRDEVIFHTQDMGVLWGISDKNTLYTTLRRYTSKGLLKRIYKGLYSLKDLHELDPILLGVKALHGPAYLSCESVLFRVGIINQPTHIITLVSGISRQFTILTHRYRSRKLADMFLMNDIGIESSSGVRTASVSRAVADMLYFNPKKYFDAPQLIDWGAVREIGDALGYSLTIPQHYAYSPR